MDTINAYQDMNLDSETRAPRYTHDCKKCIFLGVRGSDDLYLCASGPGATVIARWSSSGPDYQSGLDFSFGAVPELTAARAIAQAKGHLPYPLELALHAMRLDADLSLQEELRQHLADSDVGRALVLLERDEPAGRAALEAFVAARVEDYKKAGARDRPDLADWAQTVVRHAQRWACKLGLVRSQPTLFGW